MLHQKHVPLESFVSVLLNNYIHAGFLLPASGSLSFLYLLYPLLWNLIIPDSVEITHRIHWQLHYCRCYFQKNIKSNICHNQSSHLFVLAGLGCCSLIWRGNSWRSLLTESHKSFKTGNEEYFKNYFITLMWASSFYLTQEVEMLCNSPVFEDTANLETMNHCRSFNMKSSENGEWNPGSTEGQAKLPLIKKSPWSSAIHCIENSISLNILKKKKIKFLGHLVFF